MGNQRGPIAAEWLGRRVWRHSLRREQRSVLCHGLVSEELKVQGLPERYASRVAEVLTKALGEFYATRPIYTLSSGDAKQAAARMVLKHEE